MHTAPNWKRTFAMIYAGQAFSIVGSSAIQFAIVWWITEQTGSALTLTTAMLCMFLPMIFLGPFAGIWVDRYPRKRIMMLSDGFIALTSLFVMIVFLVSEPSMPFIYLMMFLRGLGNTFHSPAMQAAIPMFVPPEYLAKAGGWSQMIVSLSNIAGPALGALLLSVMPIGPAMLVDVVGAAVAILALLCVRIPELPPKREKVHLLRDMKDGFGALYENKPLFKITIPSILTTVLYMPLGALFPLLVLNHYDGTAWHNSVVEIAFSLGLLLASFWVGIKGSGKRPFQLIAGSITALGIVSAVSGWLPPNLFVLFVTCSFLMGVSGTLFNIPYMAYIQQTIAPDKMGKVLSLITSAMALASPAGLLLSGPLTDTIGIDRWFLGSGLAMTLIGLLCFYLIRGMHPLEGPSH